MSIVFIQNSTICNYSTIFKTFKNDIDKGFQATDNSIGSTRNSDSILQRLYPSKEAIQAQLIDVNKLYPELNDTQFTSILSKLTSFNKRVVAGTRTWQDYFNGLNEGERWQIKFVQNTDLQKASLDNVKKGYNDARNSAIAHNAALQQQTLSAKAGQAVLDGLATAGNMLLAWGISEAISFAISGFDKLVNAEKYAQEAFEKAKTATDETAKSIRELKSEMSDTTTKASELSSDFARLVQDVNPFTNENKTLSTEEYENFLDVSNQLAELFPSLTKNYDENGNAILNLSGDVNTVTKSIAGLVEQQNNLAKADIRKHLDEYVNGNDDSDGVFTALKGYKKNVEDSNNDLESLETTYDSIINQKGKKYFVNGRDYDNYLNNIKYKFGQEISDRLRNTKEKSYYPQKTTYTIDFSKLQLDEETKGKITESYNTFYQDLQSNLETETSELENKNQEMSDMMMIWVEDLDIYKNADSEQFKNAIQMMVNSIQWSDFDVKEENIDEAKQIIQSLILTPISSACNDPDTKLQVINAINSLFSIDFSKLSYKGAYANIVSFLTPIMDAINKYVPDDQKKSLDDMFSMFNLTEYKDSSDKMRGSLSGMAEEGTTEYKKLESYTAKFTQNQTEQWLSVTNGVKNADEAIQKYEASLKSTQKAKKNITFTQVWEKIDETGTDEHKETKEKLLELAKAGKLTEKEFENSSIADTFKESGVSAEEATKKINKMIDSAEQLSTMRTGISAITSAYDEKKNSKHKVVSASTIESLGDTLGIESWSPKNQKVWENYKNIAGDSSKSLKDLKTAQDQLATSFVTSNNFLSNLDNTNKDYYTGLLEEMGVLNAESIVNQALIASEDEATTKKINSKLATIDLINATSLELTNLGNELTALYGSSEALGLYIIKKQLASGNALSTSESIGNLIALAEQCGYTGAAIQTLSAMQKNQKQLENLDSNDPHAPDIAANIEYENKGLKEELDKYTNKKVKLGKVKTIDSSNTNNSPSDKDSGKESKQQFDWLERRLTRMQNIIDLTASKLQNLFSVKAKNKNLDRQIKQTTKLLNQYKKAAKKYQNKADEIAKGSTKKTKNGKKKKDKGLSESIVKKIQSGEVTKANYKKLLKGYNESTFNKISQYIDYFDKAQNAKKSVQEQKAKIREKEQEKLQNNVDLHDSRIARAEAKEAKEIWSEKGYQNKNDAIDTQIKNLKLSYQYQKEIADLTRNQAEYDRLEYEMQKKIAELKLQQIQNTQQYYENQIGLVDNAIQDIDNSISLAQARGNIVTAGYYQNLNRQQVDKRSKSVAEKSAIESQLAQAIKDKTIQEYSDEWYEIQSTLQNLDNTINECDVAIAENTTAIREVHTALLEAKAQNMTNLNTEAEFIATLLSRNDLTDSKTGTFTNAGLGTLGTYGIELETAQSMMRELNKERAILEAMKKSGSLDYGDVYHKYDSDKQLEEAYTALIAKQQEWTTNEFNAEQQIIDLMKKYYESQLNYMKEIIDAKKEVLSYEKDLYDYERNIADKTKNIATLEKQLAALQGDNSEEGRARKTQIQLRLDEANQDLQDTEYDKYISDQQNMLDNLMAEYEDLMNNLFKDTDALLKQGIEAINKNATLIQGIMNKAVDDYGYNYSSDFQDIINQFKSGGVVTGIKDSLYSDTSSIASILDIQNKYLEQKYGENTSDSSGNVRQPAPTDVNLVRSGNTITGDLVRSGSTIIAEQQEQAQEQAQKEEERKRQEEAMKNELKNIAEDFIKENKQKAKKDPSKYSDLNKKIYDKTKGYVLSDADLKKLASNLGVTYNNAKSTGNLYNKLKELGVKGFRTGGIVRTTGVASDGDYIPIRVNPNETVLTQDFTDMLPTAVDIMDKFVQIQGLTRDNALPQRGLGSQTFGDIVINAELPNVHSAKDFVHALQNDAKVQKAFTIATKDLMNKGRITNNIQSIS